MFYSTSEKGIGFALLFREFNDVVWRVNAQRQSIVFNFHCNTLRHSKFKIMLVFYHELTWSKNVLMLAQKKKKKSRNNMEYHWFSEVLWHFYVNILGISEIFLQMLCKSPGIFTSFAIAYKKCILYSHLQSKALKYFMLQQNEESQ